LPAPGIQRADPEQRPGREALIAQACGEASTSAAPWCARAADPASTRVAPELLALRRQLAIDHPRATAQSV
jgi:hypothetical protein